MVNSSFRSIKILSYPSKNNTDIRGMNSQIVVFDTEISERLRQVNRTGRVATEKGVESRE
jgi:hypothetical protein